MPIISLVREIVEEYFRSKQTCSASIWLRGLAAAHGNATDQIETVEIAAQPPASRDGLVFDDAGTLNKPQSSYGRTVESFRQRADLAQPVPEMELAWFTAFRKTA